MQCATSRHARRHQHDPEVTTDLLARDGAGLRCVCVHGMAHRGSQAQMRALHCAKRGPVIQERRPRHESALRPCCSMHANPSALPAWLAQGQFKFTNRLAGELTSPNLVCLCGFFEKPQASEERASEAAGKGPTWCRTKDWPSKLTRTACTCPPASRGTSWASAAMMWRLWAALMRSASSISAAHLSSKDLRDPAAAHSLTTTVCLRSLGGILISVTIS